MIFYFSGTGNSKWAAKSLAGLLHEKTADISVLNFESAGNKEYKNYIEEIAQGIKNDEYIGFVFPVYAWGAPEIVTDFVKKLKKSLGNANKFGDAADNPEGKTFTFALATCGEEAGYALKNFSKIIPLKSSYSLVMPNNYVVGSDLEDEGTVLSVLRNAKEEVKRMAEELIAKKEVCRVNEGSAAGLKSGPEAPKVFIQPMPAPAAVFVQKIVLHTPSQWKTTGQYGESNAISASSASTVVLPLQFNTAKLRKAVDGTQ